MGGVACHEGSSLDPRSRATPPAFAAAEMTMRVEMEPEHVLSAYLYGFVAVKPSTRQ
jgi:hypothetical protein